MNGIIERVKNTFVSAFDLFSKNLGNILIPWLVVVGVNLLTFLIIFGLFFVTVGAATFSRSAATAGITSLLFFLVAFIVGYSIFSITYLGFIRVCLKVSVGVKAEIKDLFAEKGLALNLFGACFLIGVIQGILMWAVQNFFGHSLFSILLNLVVYFGVFITSQFFPIFITDKRSGPLDSIKISFAMTSENIVFMLIIDFILFILNIIGYIMLGLGLFITVPFTVVILTIIYRDALIQTEMMMTNASIES